MMDYCCAVMCLSLSFVFFLYTHKDTHTHTHTGCHVSSSLTSYCSSISRVPGGTLKSCLAKLTLELPLKTLRDVIYVLDCSEKHYSMYGINISMFPECKSVCVRVISTVSIQNRTEEYYVCSCHLFFCFVLFFFLCSVF